MTSKFREYKTTFYSTVVPYGEKNVGLRNKSGSGLVMPWDVTETQRFCFSTAGSTTTVDTKVYYVEEKIVV